MQKLIIVESPAKCKTITKLLKGQYLVLATYGHILELKQDIKAVDVDNDFALTQKVIKGKAEILKKIVAASKKSTTIYLAMDGDREGEGIASSVYEYIANLPNKQIHRIKFYEITKSALENSLAHPGLLDTGLIDAYHTRRTLDFLIGFHISPILWTHLHSGLSAGRVQSPSLSIICDRQQEIDNFQPKTYWDPLIDSSIGKLDLTVADGMKIEPHSIDTLTLANTIQTYIEKQCKIMYVAEITKSKKSFAPPLAYRTARLQRDAFNAYNFSLKRTMDIAQTLYDGSASSDDISLITYMRTDSTDLGLEALASINIYISEQYEPKYQGSTHKKTSNKKILHVQESHEAIRPVDIYLTPEHVKSQLNQDSWKIYDLIWRKTVASQMSKSQCETLSIKLASEDGMTTMKTSMTKQTFAGWKILYPSTNDEIIYPLNNLRIHDKITVNKFKLEEKVTQPPGRLSQSTLLKRLEELGIGRPSTYANIIDTLYKRQYVESDTHSLIVSDIGKKVNAFLHQHFQIYIDYDFTAKIEAGLDKIAINKQNKLEFLHTFWNQLKSTIELAIPKCPTCGTGNLIPKMGFKYLGCSNYPTCRYIKNLKINQITDKEKLDRNCASCSSQLVKITLGNGLSFVGCSNFPKCKYIEPKYINLDCSECGKPVQERYNSTKNSKFYSCSDYPKCLKLYPLHKSTCPICSSIEAIKTSEDTFLCLSCESVYNCKKI